MEKKKKEIEQSRMECIRCITHIAALMVTQKQWRRGAHPRREASDKDPKGGRGCGRAGRSGRQLQAMGRDGRGYSQVNEGVTVGFAEGGEGDGLAQGRGVVGEWQDTRSVWQWLEGGDKTSEDA